MSHHTRDLSQWNEVSKNSPLHGKYKSAKRHTHIQTRAYFDTHKTDMDKSLLAGYNLNAQAATTSTQLLPGLEGLSPTGSHLGELAPRKTSWKPMSLH